MTLPACDRIIELSKKATPGPLKPRFIDAVDIVDLDEGRVAIMTQLRGPHGLLGRRNPNEVEALAKFFAESRTLAPKIALALNEAVRAIEEIAPHHEGCSAEFHHSHHLYGPCTCWKRAALDRINELLKEGK